MRNTSGLRRGGPGRPKGVPNKANADVREIAHGMLSRPEYVEALNDRLVKGTAGAVEPLLWHYRYGKPVETTAIIGEDGGPVRHVLQIVVKDKP